MAKRKVRDNVTGQIIEVDDSQLGDYGLSANDFATPTPQPKQQTTPQPKAKSLSENVGSGALDLLKGALGSILNPVSNFANKALSEQQKSVKNTKKGDIISALTNAAQATKNTFLSPEAGKAAAETASFAVPFGKAKQGADIGMRALTKYLAPGAAVGGLSGVAQENATPQSVTGDALLGAAGGGVLGTLLKTGKLTSTGTRKILGGTGQKLEEQATKTILRATPSSVKNAIQDHGLDVNNLYTKHFKGITDYDEILGKASDRGSGGLLGGKIEAAETTINKEIKAAGSTIRFSADEFTKALNKEKSLLKKTIGNESKVADLDQLIKDVEKRFKNGASAKQLLDMKRAADSKFGKSVTETEKGSVVTSTQKVLANTARSLLKSRFRNITKALDEETELYTLKPILNGARAGEEGGRGGLGMIDALFTGAGGMTGGPLGAALGLGIKKAAEDPKIVGGLGNILNKASQGMQKPNAELNPMLMQILGQVSSRGGRLLPNVSTTSATEAQANSQNYNNNPSQDSFHADTLSQADSNVNSQPDQAKVVKQALTIAMMQDLANGGKNITELKAISDAMTQAYETEGEDAKKYSEGDKKFLLAKNEAMKAMSLLGQGSVTSGKFPAAKSEVEEFFGVQNPNTTQFKAQLATARTAARNALLGANMSDAEMESYLDAIFSYSNEPEIIKAKLQTFIKSMQDYEGSIAGHTPDQLLAQ